MIHSMELIFAEDGVCIGDREKHNAVSLSYADMFRITHEFLNEFYRYDLKTQYGDKLRLQRLKEGDGSPYPIIATGITPDNRTIEKQLKYEDVVGIYKPEEKQ